MRRQACCKDVENKLQWTGTTTGEWEWKKASVSSVIPTWLHNRKRRERDQKEGNSRKRRPQQHPILLLMWFSFTAVALILQWGNALLTYSLYSGIQCKRPSFSLLSSLSLLKWQLAERPSQNQTSVYVDQSFLYVYVVRAQYKIQSIHRYHSCISHLKISAPYFLSLLTWINSNNAAGCPRLHTNFSILFQFEVVMIQ